MYNKGHFLSLKWFIAFDLFLVRMITLKRSGKDLKITVILCKDVVRYLPWYPISGLLGIDPLVILVISKVFKAIKDHNDSALAVSASSTITLTMFLRLIGAAHL